MYQMCLLRYDAVHYRQLSLQTWSPTHYYHMCTRKMHFSKSAPWIPVTSYPGTNSSCQWMWCVWAQFQELSLPFVSPAESGSVVFTYRGYWYNWRSVVCIRGYVSRDYWLLNPGVCLPSVYVGKCQEHFFLQNDIYWYFLWSPEIGPLMYVFFCKIKNMHKFYRKSLCHIGKSSRD